MTSRALLLVAGICVLGAALISAQTAPAPGNAPAQTTPAAPASGRGAPPPMPPASPPGPADHTNSVGMEFMRIEPGRMIAGRYNPNPIVRPAPRGGGPAAGRGGQTPAGPGRGGGFTWTDEQLAEANRLIEAATTPGFAVTIDRPYYIGRYEVTQAEWKRVMGPNPSVFQGDTVTGDADRHPVDSVTWDDAQAFIRRLNEMEKTTAYRLPTEFEWEWAARAGSEDALPTPGEGTNKAVMFRQGGTTSAVGTMHPNDWGLYDMLGNVWEWVQDYYNGKAMPDAVPPTSGTQRVLKGGSFMSHVANIVSTVHAGGPGDGFSNGFRIVKDVP